MFRDKDPETTERNWRKVGEIAKKQGFVTSVDLLRLFPHRASSYVNKRLGWAVEAGLLRRDDSSQKGTRAARGRPEVRYVLP